jgi:hypothetical protein
MTAKRMPGRETMLRCPYCKERIKKGAVRCKHCHSSISNGNTDDDGITYLQNGFVKINKECDAIEGKVNVQTGFIFTRYQYPAEELWRAVGRIESFAEKIRDDVERWSSADQLSQRIRFIYNREAEAVHERLEELHAMMEQREPTLWEKICSVFRRIAEQLLPLLSFRLVSKVNDPKRIAA